MQLSFNGTSFAHTLVIIENGANTLVATHTFDSFGRDLNTYAYQDIRFIHVEGVRMW